MTLEDQLRALIDSSPAHIQRHFACDCAERVLNTANVMDRRSWKAVEVVRLYAEGRATIGELDVVRDAVRGVARDAVRDAARDAVRDAAWIVDLSMSTAVVASAAEESASVAARDASVGVAGIKARSKGMASLCDAEADAVHRAAWDEERAWQIAHIQSLLAAHNAARSSLLSILQQRAEMIQKVLPRNAQTLEEALFT